MATAPSWAEKAQQAARDAGFELAGVAPLPAGSPELAYFPGWVERGWAGEMEYLKGRAECGEYKRCSLRHAAPWARSVVVCALNYNSAAPYSTEPHASEAGWISRYAWFQRRPAENVRSSADYHDHIMARLCQVEAAVQEAARAAGCAAQTRRYVDTGPLVERVAAKYAGVGWIGKNTCIIDQQQGSWLFLGVVLTSLEAPPQMPAPDRCGTCTRCIEACPTQAIPAPYQLDASRCISYLTIEKRGAIPEELRADMGRHLFGCDICQDVCPWNQGAPVASAPEFEADPRLVNPALEWIAGMSQAEFQQTFRSSPVKRAKYSGLRRNAVIAMGNSGERRFISQLRQLAEDPDTTVAEHARWALARLGAMALGEPTAK